MTTPLSQDEIDFFKQNGYLIQRAILDADLMARAREALWENPPPGITRDDPDSWVGPLEECDDADSNRYGYSWKYRKPGREQWMVELLPKNPTVWAIAEQLLGEGSLEEPQKIRGIYCQMREGDKPETPYRLHIDQHPFHLGLVAYIDDVAEDGGGFNVWPGTHKIAYHAFETQHTFTPPSGEEVNAKLQQLNDGPRVDCHGRAGDVVFWHHRLGHSAGHNRSRNIRQAVLYDFKKKDLEALQELPPHENMWKDWAV